jgi:tellurite resistance protein
MLTLTSAQVQVALGAARVVASADGRFDEHEQRLLSAAARALHYDGPIEDASPEQVAAAVSDEATRLRIVQALILVAMIDGEVQDAEHAAIRSYANALGVDEPRLANLKHLAHGHTRLLYFDLWRRSAYLQDSAKKAWHDKGLRGLYQFFGSLPGIATDAKTAARYQELGELPEGTFGRAYFQHMTERKFSFPGEKRGFPEELVKHDLAHVIGGYDTNPEGECEVIAFIAGFMKHDPFGYLFMVVIHMQLGVNIFDGSPVERMIVPMERCVSALERGNNVTRDLYDPEWDFWAEFPLPLDEVRRKYGVSELVGQSLSA